MNGIEKRKNKGYYDGFFTGNYTKVFENEVTAIHALRTPENVAPSIEERKQIINAISDAYIEQTGKVPEGIQLHRLSNWLLLEDMADSHPDKIARTEYPFMTKRQLRTRHRRESASEHLEETHTKNDYLGGKKDGSMRSKIEQEQ